ncbi:Putative aminoglycoside phosphotransferase, protein kinase-like domain superfamily [Colletotrichum destructivum]|uniref:Aminoglycoside phosphotransferase, protein kinase-like domain superfamily n=1 Tax=Colletotrichum destructivum TaxID=34406 RepID=A0AAX4IJV2_9PEZI|nr:Putative aminoglycoside phosphotransferase, protein kinase-like domain superfamily [Colletotrichum destructivum]
MAADPSASWTTVHGFLQYSDAQTASCFRRVRWDRLCSIALSANRGLKCVALDRVASGLNNVVRELECSDQTRWAARVPIERGGPPQAGRIELGTEVATMQFITERSSLPVPRILAYDTDEDNAAAVPFMLIEILPGIVAMDALGGYGEHRGVQMTALSLPKIGTITRSPDGGYKSGPLLGIGSPFDTAAAFFKAWADTVEFKRDKETITRMMQRGPIVAEHMVAIIDGFPRRIKAMASRRSRHNEGPSPLCHGDFLRSNIMVDKASFNVTGVIDWEDAGTVPWELVAFPEFLQAMPPSFDLPQHYSQDGQPLGQDARERWRERREYVEMFKSAERDGGGDDLLSAHLSSDRSQALAYLYGAFTSTGKLGFYDRVMEEMEKGV